MATGLSKLLIAVPVALISGLIGGASAYADVVTDGTAGPRVRLGGDFEIGADLGTRAGRNLFHSFERFSLTTGERATFSGPDEIRNIISRVTGGARSDIDGTIRSTIPGADFYFLNPAGVAFGPNATLDLQGSFHVSTADELRFADGATFSATTPTASSFTVAPPEAFGFLGARDSTPILIDQSVLEVHTSKSFSLVGGDITIGGDPDAEDVGGPGTVRAEAGTITLTAVGGLAEVDVTDGQPDAEHRADIRLRGRALIDTSGDGGGAVNVRGGRLLVDDSSRVLANNTGSINAAGGVEIDVDDLKLTTGSIVSADARSFGSGGQVAIAADRIEIRAGSTIGAATIGEGDAGSVTVRAGRLLLFGDQSELFTGITGEAGRGSSGDAGTVTVEAREIELHNEGSIGSSTFGEGHGGEIQVKARRILISGDASGFFTGIGSQAESGSTGDAGTVMVRARDLELRGGGGVISSSTFGTGRGGDVLVEAERLHIDGEKTGLLTGITSDAGDLTGDPATILAGNAGTVTVKAGELEMRDGGSISSFTSTMGDAGGVTVEAERVRILNDDFIVFTGITSQSEFSGDAGRVMVRTGELELRGGGSLISSDTLGAGEAGAVVVNAARLHIVGDDSGIRNGISSVAVFGSSGAAGRIMVTASAISLADGGSIASASGGTGVGGNVIIRARDVFRSSGGSVTARTAEADAGDITIVAGRLIDLKDSEITTSAAGGEGSGGNILIDPEFVVLDNSRIVAEAAEGRGGFIRIVANELVRSPDSAISAASGVPALSGTVVISAPEVDLSGGLVVLEGAIVDTSQLRERCGARRDIGASSFTGVGRGGLPPSPDGPLAGAYAADVAVEETHKARSRLAEKPVPASTRLAGLVAPCAPLD